MKRIVSFFGDRSPVFVKLNARAEAYAQQKGVIYEWAPQLPYDSADVVTRLNGADAGIIDIEPYNDEIFSQLDPQVKLLVRFGVGFDKVDLEAASGRGIAIARTTGANTMGVAEMALSLMLACRRQLKLAQKKVDTGDWDKSVANETVGATVGVLGFGAIGKAFARLVKGLGCTVIAYDPYGDPEAAQEMGVELVDLDTLFHKADAISVHVPYSETTHNLVDEERLRMMKSSAVIVNTSRGGIVDEEALYRACRDGVIRGAGWTCSPRNLCPFLPPSSAWTTCCSPPICPVKRRSPCGGYTPWPSTLLATFSQASNPLISLIRTTQM